MHPKFTVLVHFGSQFTTQKPKKLPKTIIYTKTASLGIPNNVSPWSPPTPPPPPQKKAQNSCRNK